MSISPHVFHYRFFHLTRANQLVVGNLDGQGTQLNKYQLVVWGRKSKLSSRERLAMKLPLIY